MFFLISQIVIGYARHQPILQDSTLKIEMTEGQRAKAELPGGASNVYLTALQLVNEKDRGNLSNEQQYTMIQWLRSLVPNTIWNGFGFSDTKTEHDLIFSKNNLQYVGGMHLLGAFYLNGGVLLVVLFGLLHGWLANIVEKVMKRDLVPNLHFGGTPALFFATVYLVYQFRYLWYNPQTMFRALLFAFLLLIITSLLIRWYLIKVHNNSTV